MKTRMPHKFSVFQEAMDAIDKFHPVAMSLIGSYGDANKTPTENSDLDLIFVFETSNIFHLYTSIVNRIRALSLYYLVELGVHYQFGYLISIYTPVPLLWMDIGIMDQHFASNYLINLPQTCVFGEITPPANHQFPSHNENHLARKILKLIEGGKTFKAKEVSYRYISWRLLELQLQGRTSMEDQLEYDKLIKCVDSFSDVDVMEFVLKDIKDRNIIHNAFFRDGKIETSLSE